MYTPDNNVTESIDGNSAIQVKTKDQSIEDNFVTTEEAKELDVVDNVSQFATGIVNWHTHNMNQLVHAMNMPETNEDGIRIAIEITSDATDRGAVDGKRVLHPKEIEAFKAGIRYAYDQCVVLPFKFIPTDADDNIQPEYNDTAEVNETEPQA